MQDIFIQSKVIDIFPKFNMAAAAILEVYSQLVPKYKRNANKCCNLRKVADVNEKCHLHGNSQI